MRKFSILVIAAALSAAAVFDSFPQQTVTCTATAPAQATVGVEV